MEELKDIPGWEGLYAATRDGRIWSYRKKKFMKPCGEPDNYQIVMLTREKDGKCYYVHRLVAMAWIPNPNNYPEVNHKNRKKDKNDADNLEWCTKQYNMRNRDYKRIKKPVYCIELDKTFGSLYEAAKEVGGNVSNLVYALKDKKRSFSGYHWEYANK